MITNVRAIPFDDGHRWLVTFDLDGVPAGGFFSDPSPEYIERFVREQQPDRLVKVTW